MSLFVDGSRKLQHTCSKINQRVAIADWLTSLTWDTNPMDIVNWVLQYLWFLGRRMLKSEQNRDGSVIFVFLSFQSLSLLIAKWHLVNGVDLRFRIDRICFDRFWFNPIIGAQSKSKQGLLGLSKAQC